MHHLFHIPSGLSPEIETAGFADTARRADAIGHRSLAGIRPTRSSALPLDPAARKRRLPPPLACNHDQILQAGGDVRKTVHCMHPTLAAPTRGTGRFQERDHRGAWGECTTLRRWRARGDYSNDGGAALLVRPGVFLCESQRGLVKFGRFPLSFAKHPTELTRRPRLPATF